MIRKSRRPVSVLTVLSLALFAAFSPVALAYDDESDPARLAIIRDMYRRVPAPILGLEGPVKVLQTLLYRDGGTIGIVFEDAKGKKLLFCLDGRLGQAVAQRFHYIGATHATHENAQRLMVRGPEEAAIYGVLLRWVEDAGKTSVDAQVVHRVLAAFDEQFGAPKVIICRG